MLRRLLDGIRPTFESGGRLSGLYPLYEAFDTFLYTPGERTQNGPHIRDPLDLKRMMSLVVVALIPCFFMAFWNTGYHANLALQAAGEGAAAGWRGELLAALGAGYAPGLWNNLLHGAVYFVPVYGVTVVVGGAWEVLFAIVRRHDVNEGFLVTSALYPLILPPTIPLWQVAVGISFGVVIGKEVFGGTGKNFLNPALTARACVFFAYPAQLTGDRIWIAVDGISQATPLGAMAAAEPASGVTVMGYSWWQAFLGTIPGSMGETSTLACLLGAVLLIATGVGSWRIMSGMTLGALAMATLLFLVGSPTNPMFQLAPWWHLVLGGFAFGVVFMATDPVSAAMTETGKWIFGVLIGVLTILIRVINPGFPEGVMLAILFGNVFAPTIDYFVVQAHVKRRQARYAA